MIVAQSPYEAFVLLPALRLLRPRPKLVVEVHGDWCTAARLYGSPERRVYAPLSDLRAARPARGGRHPRADASHRPAGRGGERASAARLDELLHCNLGPVKAMVSQLGEAEARAALPHWYEVERRLASVAQPSAFRAIYFAATAAARASD